MNRLFFKKAYTLAEILFVIAIIGIISTVIIHNTKSSQNQYKKLYAVAFNTLQDIAKDATSQWTPTDGTTNCDNYYWSSDCWTQYVQNGDEQYMVGGIQGFPRQYPGFLYGNPYTSDYSSGSIDGTGTDVKFCKALTSQINTVDEDNQCKSFISGVRPEKDMRKGQNFLETFCALIEVTDSAGNVVVGDNDERVGQCAGDGSLIPSFVASNGQKFYISTVMYANPPYIDAADDARTGFDKKQTERMAFRFIVVDLNGDNGPNTQLRVGNKMPDLVLFAITASGSVIPLGWPEFDELYLSASVYYPKLINAQDPANPNRYKKNEKEHSDIMTFFDAKMHAWAGDASGGCTGCYYGQPLLYSQPYSYSNLFYYWGYNCCGGTSGVGSCPGCTAESGVMNGKFYADSLMASLLWQFMYYTGYNGNSNYVTNSFIPTTIITNNIDTEYGCKANTLTCSIGFSDK